MTVKVREFFQLRITVRRKHLPVGIDINTFTVGLFQYFLKVFQIMTGDQNALAFYAPEELR